MTTLKTITIMKNWQIGSKVSFKVALTNNDVVSYTGTVTDVFEPSTNPAEFVYEVTTSAGVFNISSTGKVFQ